MNGDITSYCSCQDLEWYGCYGSGAKYNKYMIPESVKHPAKMSWELLERIFKHLESMNLLTPESVVIDFMAGTGRTNTMAVLRGYRTISVELEPHFIEMIAGYDCDGKTISDFKIEPAACGSEVLHRYHKVTTGLAEVECSGNPHIFPVCRCGERQPHAKHHIPGNREVFEQVTGRKVIWDVIQGDARELSRLLDESGMVGVISPPYGEQMDKRHDSPRARDIFRDKNWTTYYSKDANNIGNLKDTPVVGVVSPPYTSQTAFQDKEFMVKSAEERSKRMREGIAGGHYGSPEALKRYAEKIMETYSQDPRNIGNLPDAPLAGIVSPPYQNSLVAKNSPSINKEKQWETYRKQGGGLSYEAFCEQQERHSVEYSSNPDNIANLKDIPLVGIMSPPYCESMDNRGSRHGDSGICGRDPKMAKMRYNESGSLENIGNLKDVPFVGIMSPPYSEAQQGGGIAIKGYSGPHIHEMGKNQPDKVGQRCGYMKEVHGSDPANIGNLPDRQIVGITSPPYGLGGGGLGNDGRQTQVQKDKHIHLHYSESDTNIGNLPDKQFHDPPIVGITSPPYANRLDGGKELSGLRPYTKDAVDTWFTERDPTNIGNLVDGVQSRDERESYLQAMFRVYQQAHLCGISPLVVVTKNPTRNGKLRRLDLDTIYLLQLSGYEIFDYHRAVLFETHTQSTLDGDSKDVHKGRISFFKRLSLEKGTTVAQWEDIIFARIPECAPDTEG